MTKRVAIIGYAHRLPGADRAGLWEALCAGRDLVSQVDASRWEFDGFLHPDKQHPGTSYTFAAGCIGDVTGFDAAFFGISPREAASMDPQQRLLLELAWEAMEHAGIRPSTVRGSDCGVYIGISTSDYAYRLADDLAAVGSTTATGNTTSIAANRISYLFDLHGPSMAIDTACSSSLVAFHQACSAIAGGEITSALAGGVSLHLHPYGFLVFAKASMLSPRGRCSVFDAAADGYVRSEGGGLFLLKDYDQACADGDRILAVVAATAVNADGRKSGLTIPSADAQASLIERACRQAGLEPAMIDYFEAHGTGTPVGDPIEARALGQSLGQRRPTDQPLPIGSIKSNLGHLEAAAGVAGLVKALLVLEHRMVPATIGITALNPAIDFDGLNLRVVTENLPLATEGPLHIGINSFGFGGVNAHVILESGPEPASETAVNPLKEFGEMPLVVTAKDSNALNVAAQAMADLLEQHPQQLYDICWSSLQHRDLHPCRAVLYGSAPQALADELRNWAAGRPVQSLVQDTALPVSSGPVFVYAGNGSQWEGMGRGLLNDPVFRASVKEVDRFFMPLAGWSLVAELDGTNGQGRYLRTEIAQPALFAMQVGITAMLRSMGIEPVAVTGHSVGEIAAAWACGALSLQQATQVIYQRSRLQGLTAGMGQMTAAQLGRSEAELLLARLALPSLALAGCNSSKGVTFAGTVTELELLERELENQGVRFRRLELDYAFHSPAMDGIRAELLEVLADLTPRTASLPFYSTVTGAVLDGSQLDAAYWWRNIREPVLFEQAVASLLAAGSTLFVSVTPHPILRGYLYDIMQSHAVDGAVVTTLQRDNDHPLLVRQAASRAIIAGATVNRATLFPKPGRFVQLPGYPWQREQHWHPVTAESCGLLARRNDHPLLGCRLRHHDATWESHLDTRRLPWLADHAVGGATVYPGTGYLELALAAAQLLRPTACVELEQLEIKAPLLLEAGVSRLVRVSVDTVSGQLTVRGRDLLSESPFTTHAVTRIVPQPWDGPLDCPALSVPERQPDFDADSHRLVTSAAGLQYGPAFQAIVHGWVEGRSATARVFVPDPLQAGLQAYHLHPVFLDMALQLVFQVVQGVASSADELSYLPVAMGQVRYLVDTCQPAFITTTLTGRSPHSLTADCFLYDQQGRPIASVRQVRFRRVRLQQQGTQPLQYLDYHRIPAPLVSQQTQLPDDLTRQVAEAATWIAEVALNDPALGVRFNELDPLLETLSCHLVAEALQAASAVNQPSYQPECYPWLDNLLQLACSHGVLQQDADGFGPDDGSVGLTAQQLWQGLVQQYPEQADLILLLGRTGLQLKGHLLAGGKPPAGAALQPLLLSQLVGASGRQIIGKALGQLTGKLRQSLPARERLRVLELSAGAPLWLQPMAALLVGGQDEYRFASPSAAARDAAEQQCESYPGCGILDCDRLQETMAGLIQLTLVAADFSDQLQAEQALAAAARATAVGGSLLMVGLHPVSWAGLAAGEAGYWQQSADWWSNLLQQYGFTTVALHGLTDVPGCGPWLLHATRLPEQVLTTQPPAAGSLLLAGLASAFETTLAEWFTAVCRLKGIPLERLQLDQSGGLDDRLKQALAAQPNLSGILLLNDLSQGAADSAYPGRLAACCAAAAELALTAETLQVGLPIRLVTIGVAADSVGGAGVASDLNSIADAPFWAFGRTMMNEYAGIDLRLICLEGGLTDAALEALLQECWQSDGEQEVILAADGGRFVPRLVQEPPPQERDQAPFDPEQTTLRLGFSLPGQLKNLRWELQLRTEPRREQVEVEVQATGLNFRDIMYTLGLLSDEAVENGFAGATLGLEFSGIVTRVGEGVTGFQPGDRVVGFGPAGFATRAITSTAALSPIPAGLAFEAAATIPATFFTAWYALCHQARLQPGEKVLIHGAAGGVGLAAIQIVRLMGGEVYATAGSDEKRDFLRLSGVQHIYDSRTLDFADLILKDTAGSGVDVVLNSLAGEAINRNLKVLKPFGRFLELGKRDFYENTSIGLRPFRNNISYFGVDADQVMQMQPELTRRLFAEIMEQFEQGSLHPLPFTGFEADQVVDAFRYMQQAQQIGKVIVTYRNGISRFHAPPATVQRLGLAADRSWLVTGGLGGFGLRSAQWLVERGCRNLILVGRSGAESSEAQAALARFRQQGVQVHAAACDVTDRGALADLLETAGQQLPPLQGVLHAATVIEDGLLRSMALEQLQRVLAPKILGGLHLHELTRDCSLDYFVLFSSATTLFGNPGQGNYVAANGWLEGLARLRRDQGLPATVVRWGAIDDVGFLARNQQIKESLTGRMGGSALRSDIALAALEQLLLHDLSGLGVMELDWPALRRFLPSAGHCRFSGLAALYGADSPVEGHEDLQRLAAELPDSELHALISGMLRQEVGQILRMQPDKIANDRSLYDIGLDSLMGVELVTALEGRFGIVLPVMALTEGPTIDKLSGRVIDHLRGAGQEADLQDGLEGQVVHLARQHAVDLPAEELQQMTDRITRVTDTTERLID